MGKLNNSNFPKINGKHVTKIVGPNGKTATFPKYTFVKAVSAHVYAGAYWSGGGYIHFKMSVNFEDGTKQEFTDANLISVKVCNSGQCDGTIRGINNHGTIKLSPTYGTPGTHDIEISFTLRMQGGNNNDYRFGLRDIFTVDYACNYDDGWSSGRRHGSSHEHWSEVFTEPVNRQNQLNAGIQHLGYGKQNY